MTAEQISREPRQRRGAGGAARQRRHGAGRQVRRGSRPRRAIYDGVAQRRARSRAPSPKSASSRSTCFRRDLLQSVTTLEDVHARSAGRFRRRARRHPDERVPGAALGHAADRAAATLPAPAGALARRRAASAARRSPWRTSKRDLPSLVRSVGNFQGINLNHADQNLLINQFRNAWTPDRSVRAHRIRRPRSRSAATTRCSVTRIGYLFSGSYSLGTDLKDDQIRALADRGNTPGDHEAHRRVHRADGQPEVLWGGLTNLGTLIGDELAPHVQRDVQPHGRQRRAVGARPLRERRHRRAHHAHAVRRSEPCTRHSSPASINSATQQVRLGGHVERRPARRAGSLRVRPGDRHARRRAGPRRSAG